MKYVIIDALNLFIRNYIANPSMTTNGELCGGTTGFLNQLRSLVEKFCPDKVIVVWESKGSDYRRSIYPDYKKGRKPPKPNRYYDEIPDTIENRFWQIETLINLLKFIPVRQIYVTNSEADDAIAYLTKYRLRQDECVIASSDRDFYQLVCDKVSIFSPNRKIIIGPRDVEKEMGIPPRNVCLLRTFCGDASDNIPGIKGAGPKTVTKRFPMLTEDRDVTLDEVLNHANEMQHKSKILLYKNVCNNSSIIRRNWRLMYLDTDPLSAEQIKKIDYVLDESIVTKNKIGMIRELINLGMQKVNVDSLFYSMIHMENG
jgi:DNA polymerase-1